jgi:large subunit ribosomal protein L13
MNRDFYSIDISKFPLGRAAAKIASIISGKHKASFVPNKDGGDFVVVLNSDKLVVTGRKKDQKIYHRFSGYPGGISSKSLGALLKVDSRKAVQNAVFGMLPKNKLRDRMMKRLLVFKDEKHQQKNDLIDITSL